MGYIARLLEFFRQDLNGVNANIAQVDVGGGENHRAPIFSAAGDDSQPLPDDRVAAIDTQGTGAIAAVGFLDQRNTGVAAAGEKRIYGRDSSGATKNEVYLKQDGTVSIGNDAASIEIKADGSIVISNSGGEVELTAAGLFLINGTDFALHMHTPGTYANGGGAVAGVSGAPLP